MSAKTTLSGAAAQIESIPFDLDANLQKHLLMIDVARAAGVDVLLFPELSLTGHGGGREASRLAVHSSHPLVAMLAQAAGPMLTVFGGIEGAADGTFFNAVFAVRDGAVGHVHRKVNLATYGKLDDGMHFVSGDRIVPFDIKCGPQPAASLTPIEPDPVEWRVATLICADTWNPPLVHLAAAQGATLMLVAVSSALEAVGPDFDNPAGWDVNLRFHALIYGMPSVMANRVGSEAGLTFWGGSRIIDPYGRVIASAEGRSEELVRARIDIAGVHRARTLLPTIRDANLPLLRNEFERVSRNIG